MTYVEPRLTRHFLKWRFQIKWLQDSKFLQFLGEQIDNQFVINTSQKLATTRWEAFKAFIRGQIKSYTSRKRRESQERIRDLESKIKLLKNKSFQGAQREHDTSKQLLQLRTQYNELTSDKATANLIKFKQHYYNQGEKPGRLLAWRIKQQQTERAITNIEDASGNVVVDLLEISTAFKKFYENLYKTVLY